MKTARENVYYDFQHQSIQLVRYSARVWQRNDSRHADLIDSFLGSRVNKN